jgi:hypothetical protein
MAKFASFNKDQFEELRKKLEESKNAGANKKDDKKSFDWRFNPTQIKGEARTIYKIRILPHVHVDGGASEPWIQNSVHIFKPKGAEKNTYQICPHSYEGDKAKCPICEHSKFWFAKKDKASEDVGRGYWRKKRWHMNVLVKEDPRKGEENQNGKVLVWEIGTKIFDKLSEALTMHKMFFWDPHNGFDFNIVIKTVGGYANYDSSDFSRSPSPIVEVEEDLDAIHDQIRDLNKLILGQKRKSYDELKAVLEGRKTAGGADPSGETSPETVTHDTEGESEVSRANDAESVQLNETEAEAEVEAPKAPPKVSPVKVIKESQPPVAKTTAKPAPKPAPKAAAAAEGDIDIDKINFNEEDPF